MRVGSRGSERRWTNVKSECCRGLHTSYIYRSCPLRGKGKILPHNKKKNPFKLTVFLFPVSCISPLLDLQLPCHSKIPETAPPPSPKTLLDDLTRPPSVVLDARPGVGIPSQRPLFTLSLLSIVHITHRQPDSIRRHPYPPSTHIHLPGDQRYSCPSPKRRSVFRLPLGRE
jgi:hypothetical protein